MRKHENLELHQKKISDLTLRISVNTANFECLLVTIPNQKS